MDERALFLSRLEFAVLLLTEQIEEILCFPLPDGKNIEEKQMIEAIYELVCMDCLQVSETSETSKISDISKTSETSVKLTDSMKPILEGIKEAEQYLMIESGNPSHPQKIAYVGKRITILEHVQEEGKAFRLFSMERQEFWKWLEDSMEIPETVIKEKTEAKQVLYENELVQKEREALRNCSEPEAFQEISNWMEQVESILEEGVYFGIRCIKKNTNKKEADNVLDLLLGQGFMNLWFLWRKPKQDLFWEASNQENLHIEPDCAELRQEITSMLWREEG